MLRVTIWAGAAFVVGLLAGAALVFPGDITHPFLAAGTKGQILMHFDNTGAAAVDVHVALKDAAGRTILDEVITAGPHRVTDRAAVNLLPGSYSLEADRDGAVARQAIDVSACRGDRYYDVRFLVDSGISMDAAQCVAP